MARRGREGGGRGGAGGAGKADDGVEPPRGPGLPSAARCAELQREIALCDALEDFEPGKLHGLHEVRCGPSPA